MRQIWQICCFLFFKGGAPRWSNVNWSYYLVWLIIIPDNHSLLLIAKFNLNFPFNVAWTLLNCALCNARPKNSFTHNQLHEVVTWNGFPSLKWVPRGAEHLLAALPSLCGPSHPKPSRLGLGWVIVEARSSDTVFHPSPSWSDSHYKSWRCVWGHCLLSVNGLFNTFSVIYIIPYEFLYHFDVFSINLQCRK